MSLVREIHESHKERLRRIEAAAWRPPPKPTPVVAKQPPRPKTPMEQLLESLLTAPKIVPESYPPVSKIQRIVAAYYNESVFDVLSQRRSGRLPYIRQVAMYLCSKLTPISNAEVGRKFGRDHTTARFGVLKIAALLESDPQLVVEIEELKILICQARLG